MGSEHQGANDTANASRSHDGCRAECTLPLTQDVVGLVGQGEGDVGEGRADNEEGTKVPDAARFGESEDTDAENFEAAVEEEEWSSQIPLVREVALSDTE